MNNLELAPENQKLFVTEDFLLMLRARFEREVIDPMWFGPIERFKSEADIRQWGQIMDLTRVGFETSITDKFEISIKQQPINNNQRE